MEDMDLAKLLQSGGAAAADAPPMQVAQAPTFQIRQNSNGSVSVVNTQTGQVMSTHADPGSARNSAASWNAHIRR